MCSPASAQGVTLARAGLLPRGQRRAPPEVARARWRASSAATRPRSRARSRSRRPAASRSTSCVYEYPDEPIPPGTTAQAASRGSRPRGRPRALSRVACRTKSRATLERELALIAQLDLRALFPHRSRHRRLRPLARHPLPGPRLGRQLGRLLLPRHHRRRSRPRSICCSSASSQPERREPPDIDVDFEHERREEVIQYIYARYGRDRAGLAATVISYRARSAVREVGRAMGLSEDTVAALAGMVWGTRSGRRASRAACARGGPRSRRPAARGACSSWPTS